MATIALYKSKVNGVGGLIDDIIKSSNNLDTQLGTLKNTLQGVDSSTCNLQDTIDSISSSSKSENEKVADLKKLNNKLTEFIELTANREAAAKAEIERAKEDFYTKYYYLKPECEKSGWEKFCDGLKKVCDWCAEHWKLLATIAIVAIAIAVLFIPGIGPIISGACWGAIFGALIGGVSGGLQSLANGGSFLKGFEDGAFSGAISGAIMGGAMAGLGVLGQAAGKCVSCMSKFGQFIKGTAAVTKVMSQAMGAFDTIAMLDGMFGSGHIAALNAKLHESTAYNVFQFGVSAVAAFTGGMASTMQCFVAGTLILTMNGLRAIEELKAGDMVYSADSETLEVSLKPIRETFVSRAFDFVRVTVNGEIIISTHDHPFYIKDKGYVSAENLWIGAELINNRGEVLLVENLFHEVLHDETRPVYNFKVEDNHTYYVGTSSILVHNANCRVILNEDGTYDCEMKYKEGWSEEQKAAARQKCEALSKADTQKIDPNKIQRDGSNTAKWRVDNQLDSAYDVDHLVDLQLNGKDAPSNMWKLDKSVNRSLGKQIQIAIKDLPVGAVFRNFYMV